MRICPKCNFPSKSESECDHCGVQFADIKRQSKDKIDRTCPWNDHGLICGLVGSLSDTTNGQGPWYCSKHWWKLKGYPERAGHQEHVSTRDRWCHEHRQAYEP